MSERTQLILPDLSAGYGAATAIAQRAVNLTVLAVGAALAILGTAMFLFEAQTTVAGTGWFEPQRVTPIRGTLSGTIVGIEVRPGDSVLAGQVLVRMDSIIAVSEVVSVRAELASTRFRYSQTVDLLPLRRREQLARVIEAQQRREQALASLRDQMTLFEVTGNPAVLVTSHVAGSHVALDGVVADVRSAEAALEVERSRLELIDADRFEVERLALDIRRLEGALNLAVDRLERLTIRAPRSGIVLTDGLDQLVNEYVQAGQTILEMAAGDEWRVTLFVAERDVNRIEIGQAVRVRAAALQADDIDDVDGEVRFIAPEPSNLNEDEPGRYRIEAYVSPEVVQKIGSHRLHRGLTVEGKIITDSKPWGALLLDRLRAFRNRI